MKNIVIIISSIIIAALSVHAGEVSQDSTENPNSETTISTAVESVMDNYTNNVAKTLETEARNAISQDTEYSMKYLTEISEIRKSKSTGYYAEAALVSFLKIQR